MRLLLDTNRLTDALRGEPAAVSTVERASEVWLPFVALAEIKAGFLCGTKPQENEALLHAFLRLPGIAALYPDRETTEV